MQNLAMAFFGSVLMLSLTTVAKAAPDECSIRDSALCLANKNCHWDGTKPGCYPGPAPYIDPCSSHEGEATCASDDTLGCEWSADAKQCLSKAKPSSAN